MEAGLIIGNQIIIMFIILIVGAFCYLKGIITKDGTKQLYVVTAFAAIVALAAVYPRFGFVVRRVEGDIEENREQILNAFRSAGFSLRSDEDGVMTFRADNFGQKLMLLGEDEIKVSQYGQWIVLDGIRRGVARVQYRLDSYIHMTRND